MGNLVFMLSIATIIAATLYWGFRNLPAEEWQMIASVPVRKDRNEEWQGVNFTYYGFFNATACAFGCAFVLVLMAMIHVPWITVAITIGSGLIVAIPAA